VKETAVDKQSIVAALYNMARDICTLTVHYINISYNYTLTEYCTIGKLQDGINFVLFMLKIL